MENIIEECTNRSFNIPETCSYKKWPVYPSSLVLVVHQLAGKLTYPFPLALDRNGYLCTTVLATTSKKELLGFLLCAKTEWATAVINAAIVLEVITSLFKSASTSPLKFEGRGKGTENLCHQCQRPFQLLS